MAKRQSIDDKLARLKELQDSNPVPDVVRELRKFLSGSSNTIVERAAKTIAELGITDLIPDLIAIFDHYIEKPTADKGCLVKMAIVDALEKLECREYEVFLKAVHHVQMEPTYKGFADTAPDLRGKGAMALSRLKYVDVRFELAALLLDPELHPRIMAVKLLTWLGGTESELLLRFKVLTGDPENDVLGECFSGLMELNAERSLEFVAGFVASDDFLVAQDAALALGQYHDERSFDILYKYWETSAKPKFKEMLFLPMALTRSERAFDFLVEIVGTDHRDSAIAAIKALQIYRGDDKRKSRIHRAVQERDSPEVAEAYLEDLDTVG